MGFSKEEILSIVKNKYEASVSGADIVRQEQEKALKQYYLMPNGKERDGHSQVQSSNTRDAVEWMIPIIMDMYLQPESPIMFKPCRGEAVEQAKAETVYTNNVLYTQNDGAILLTEWFKSALIYKNGYVKCYWDENVLEEKEEYEGLSLVEYQKLLADDEIEITEVAEYVEAEQQGQVIVQIPRFDVKCTRREDVSQVRIENLASDHIVVDAAHNKVSLRDCNYTCHFETRTKSDLIVDGYNKKDVEALSDKGAYDDENSLDSLRRNATGYTMGDNGGDWTQEEVVVYEHYIRMDKNGDGKAELYKVVEAGDTVLSVEEVDSNPIIAITPFVIPNSHLGFSLADMTEQTQDISTAVMRQVLDNLNHTNNPMKEIDITKVVNPQQAAQVKLGGVVLSKGQGGVTPITVPFIANESLPVLQYVEDLEEKRTGLSRESVGLNSEALAQSTNYVGAMALNQSQLKARFIVSMFAHTGVKELVLRIRELVMKYMDSEDVAEMSGQYIEVDPRTWRKRRDTVVRVGLGVVQKQEKVTAINQIAALQEKIIAMQEGLSGPFVTQDNIYNTLSDYEEMTGTTSVGRYFSNPANYTPPPPKEDPVSEALQIEEAKLATKAQKDAADIEIKRKELELEERKVRVKEMELTAKLRGVQ